MTYLVIAAGVVITLVLCYISYEWGYRAGHYDAMIHADEVFARYTLPKLLP